MNNILTEKEYQAELLNILEKQNGYIIRKANNFDRYFAIDRGMLFEFLTDTQPEVMDSLRKIYKERLEETLISFINAECTKKSGSLLEVLKHGVELSGHHLNLMYTKPSTTFNPNLTAKYKKNRFSVMEEVWINDTQRVDIVTFLNGFAIIALELKCNFSGQSIENAIVQYRKERDPNARLFLFKAGVLVSFGMDLNEVCMTTRLDGEKTYFLPFNQGNGEGVNVGKGNPPCETEYPVHYMWDDILKKDTILDLISKFIFIKTDEKEDEKTGEIKKTETIIFPRYHQLDAIRKLLEDVSKNKTALNYLIQHSAGSGKTNTIAWLAYRLANLHDADNKIIFDNIIIMTDRIVVDRQLQKAVMGMEHKSGLIRIMDEKCNSTDLALALNGNTKIIATTIQKFPHIIDDVKSLKNKHFAVIIDEAHSSTTGKDMAAVTKSLGKGDELYPDMEDEIAAELAKNGKQGNVSMFAFTATPKPTTLQLFGT
ncbi:MAG: type I restriction endonuclease subunit R, partial [Oscillospiraceae bacterium]|nr:type I restriction endonuclease subunit R [Oscillospiraceae bacterium]